MGSRHFQGCAAGMLAGATEHQSHAKRPRVRIKEGHEHERRQTYLERRVAMLKCPKEDSREQFLIEVAPSILSADFARLAEDANAALGGGATLLHVDVMDGHFVPNITIGPPVVASLRKAVDVPLDCHLMIENPDEYIPGFCRCGGELDHGASGGLPSPEPQSGTHPKLRRASGCGDQSRDDGADPRGGARYCRSCARYVGQSWFWRTDISFPARWRKSGNWRPCALPKEWTSASK